MIMCDVCKPFDKCLEIAIHFFNVMDIIKGRTGT